MLGFFSTDTCKYSFIHTLMKMKQVSSKSNCVSVPVITALGKGILALCPLSEPSKIANYKMHLKSSNK